MARTITQTVYKFSELSDDVQEKVIEKYHNDFGIDYNNRLFEESANELLALVGFKNVRLSYSLNYCQGDGLSFTFEIETNDLINILERIQRAEVLEEGYQRLIDITLQMCEFLKKYGQGLTAEHLEQYRIGATSTRTNYHYSYADTCNIEASCYPEDGEEEQAEEIRKQTEKLVYAWYKTICKTLEDLGYEWIYERISVDDFQELAEANNWEYFADGEIY